MRIGKIPITIYPSFWFLAVFIGIYASSISSIFIWIPIIFVSVLVHELGHALLAKKWGQRAHIELWALGGTTIRQGGTLSAKKEFTIVLMGPLFGFTLAALANIVAEIISTSAPNLSVLFKLICSVNIFWSILNLLPVHPLDGGKLVSTLLEGLFGHNGLRASYFMGGAVAVVLCILFLSANPILGCIFLALAFENFRSWKSSKFTVSESQEWDLLADTEKAVNLWHANQQNEAIEHLETICKGAEKGRAIVEATEKLGQYLLAVGRPQESFNYLSAIQNRLSAEGLRLLQLSCYQLKKWKEALQYGEKAFREESDGSCALLNAFSAARLLQPDVALNWLRSAKTFAALDLSAAIYSEDFAAIRDYPPFQQFAKALRYMPK